MSRGKGPLTAKQAGYTYVGLLIAVAVLSVGLAAAGQLWSAHAQRAREQELRWIGAQFVKAIGSYYHATPGHIKQYPPSLEALLLDNRFVFTRRHLRKIYANPYGAQAGWGLVPAPRGGVMGVFVVSGPPHAQRVQFVFVPETH